MSELEGLCVNAVRALAMDAVQRANSGHPGLPLGAAPMAYVLWTRFLRHSPRHPRWPDRDRFVLSAGHGSALLYSLLYLSGYDLPLFELKRFRQWESRTPGHPECGLTPGVETTTGPLGQGFSNAVGLAIAEKFLAATFNRPGHQVVRHAVYALVSDGDLMEGISHEAASLAGHLELDNLVVLYDDNGITIEGSTDLACSEDALKRFAAYGWSTRRVADGNDLEGVEAAIREARAQSGKPSLVAVRTHIGYGSPHKQDSAAAHGAPLGEEEVALTKRALGWPSLEPFFVPQEVLAHFRRAVKRGQAAEEEWQASFERYRQEHPELAAGFQAALAGELPPGWDAGLRSLASEEKPLATRQVSGRALNALARRVPTLLGGSADLAPSNNTWLEREAAFAPGCRRGRNFHFGVREHAMGGILNGLALHGGVIPYGGTFLAFSDYLRPSIRLAALMKQHVIYVFTHDSIGLGQDGPTHQPVEQLAALRAIPGLTVIRPADAAETAAAWRVALERRGPVALALSRQSLPPLPHEGDAFAAVARGGYVLADAPEREPEVILIGTGSEAQLAWGAQQALLAEGVAARAVSLPSWELFAEQPPGYRDRVLPPTARRRLAVEAGVSQGWERFVGLEGSLVVLDRFGASAPGAVVREKLGFTVESVLAQVKRLLG